MLRNSPQTLTVIGFLSHPVAIGKAVGDDRLIFHRPPGVGNVADHPVRVDGRPAVPVTRPSDSSSVTRHRNVTVTSSWRSSCSRGRRDCVTKGSASQALSEDGSSVTVQRAERTELAPRARADEEITARL